MEEKNMKKATIRDVAKAAGVSQSTVSRVLNNNGYVGGDARRRVEEAMEALHYSPSAIAVCLSKSRSRMIGVIVPQIFAPFFSQMYYIANRIMERYGYRLLLCNSDESLKREKELIDDLLSYKIAALFIVPVDRDEGTNKAYLNHIRNTGMPVVCVDREIEGLYYDLLVPWQTACLLDQDDTQYIRLIQTLNEAVNLLDLRRPGNEAFHASVQTARAATAILRIWQTRPYTDRVATACAASVTPARSSALRCRRRIFSLRRLKIRSR